MQKYLWINCLKKIYESFFIYQFILKDKNNNFVKRKYKTERLLGFGHVSCEFGPLKAEDEAQSFVLKPLILSHFTFSSLSRNLKAKA